MMSDALQREAAESALRESLADAATMIADVMGPRIEASVNHLVTLSRDDLDPMEKFRTRRALGVISNEFLACAEALQKWVAECEILFSGTPVPPRNMEAPHD